MTMTMTMTMTMNRFAALKKKTASACLFNKLNGIGKVPSKGGRDTFVCWDVVARTHAYTQSHSHTVTHSG
jgi:hypothetical protein